MKQKLTALLLAALCLLAVACTPKKEKNTDRVFSFLYQNTEIKVGGKAAPVLEQLKGQNPQISAKASCLSGEDGEDVTYVYGGFRIQTFRLKENDENEQIRLVVLLDDSVATREGVTIGAKAEVVKEKYGEANDETAYRLAYEGKGMRLVFTLRDGSVTGVSYEVVE